MSAGAAPVPARHGEPSAFDRLLDLVAGDLSRTDALIRERMESRSAPLIPTLAAHLIGAGGKRIRPVLTLASARLNGYAGEHHIRLAATVEFIHSATLLHDDVVDESDLRRGAVSANFRWGNKNSILVGDYVFARSFQLMVETGSLPVLGILADASAVIAEGEVLQLSTQRDLSTDEGRYLAVIRGKTAALFAAAAEVGAVIAGAAPGRVAAMRTYGEALGAAFQLADDLLDYGGATADLGKNVGDDFREGKVTMPVILAYRDGSQEERGFWRRVIEKRAQADGDLDTALDLMRRRGALAATREMAMAEARRAQAALEAFPASPMRDALAETAGFVVARAF